MQEKLVHIINDNGTVLGYLHLNEDDYYPTISINEIQFFTEDGKFKTLFEMKEYELETLRKQLDNKSNF